MTTDASEALRAWLRAAQADADRRGLPELKAVLETVARATQVLRAADFNDNAAAPAAPSTRR